MSSNTPGSQWSFGRGPVKPGPRESPTLTATARQDTENVLREIQTIKLKFDAFGYLTNSSFCTTKGTVDKKLKDEPQSRGHTCREHSSQAVIVQHVRGARVNA